MNDNIEVSVVISGSFRKHFDGIQKKILEFEQEGIKVLSPNKTRVIDSDAEFVILESDETSDVRLLELNHLRAIQNANGLYVYNPDGEIGTSVAFEIGWALSVGKPIFVENPPNDVMLQTFCEQFDSLEEVKGSLSLVSRRETLSADTSLQQLQKHISIVSKLRGFEKETPIEIMLLLTEELGELAKAVRKDSHLLTDANADKGNFSISDELADMQIYLLHLASVCGISLIEATIEKEKRNQARKWK